MPNSKSYPWGNNTLLSGLPRKVRDRLQPHAERLTLETKYVFSEPDESVLHVYFPVDGIASLVNIMDNGMLVEVAAVGREGMVGLPAFLRSGSMPTKTFVQVAGDFCRMPSRPLLVEFERGEELSRMLLLYTQSTFNQVARTASCNRVHPIRQRCARWLLVAHDGVARDRFDLTQDFLAQMLGVRRAGVNVAARDLQQEGLITYARGRLSIVDRAGLEAASCDCYRIIRADYRRLFGGPDSPGPVGKGRPEGR